MAWVKINKNYELRVTPRRFLSFKASSVPLLIKRDHASALVEAGVAEEVTREQAMEMKAVVTGSEDEVDA